MAGGFGATAPWKVGKPQTLTNNASVQKTAAFGAQTRAIMVSCITTNAAIRVGSDAGGALTCTATDFNIKTSDPPLVIGCAPGDKLATLAASGTVYVAELDR